MKVYYNVEIATASANEVTESLMEDVERRLGAGSADRDEMEMYTAVLFFRSDIKPDDMEKRVRELLADHADELYYVDVVYRWEHEMVADRFVIWPDGSRKFYTGHIYYEEDK